MNEAETRAEGIKSQLESIEFDLSKNAEIINNNNQFFIPPQYWTEIRPKIRAFTI